MKKVPFTQTQTQCLIACRAHTERKGKEFCFLLKDDKILMSKEGTKHGISFNSEERNMAKTANLLVHSHPINSSLSYDDIRFASYYDLTIAAITPRKDVYWAIGDYNNIFESLSGRETLDYNINIYRKCIKENPEKQSIIDRYWSHIFCIVLNYNLDIDYNYQISFETKEEIKDVELLYDSYGCMY